MIARRAPADQIGDPLYNLVVVVDDAAMEITHVIRGEDHIANTAKQLLLYEALGLPLPTFAHAPDHSSEFRQRHRCENESPLHGLLPETPALARGSETCGGCRSAGLDWPLSAHRAWP